MSHVQIYDRAICCSTGVCGPQVDPVLPKFAADLEWLEREGHQVDRFNLAQDAAQYAANSTVQKMLEAEGVDCLPLIFVDGKVVSRNEYPTRENLALWTETKLPVKNMLPMAEGGCSGGSGCC
ncbi:arsenite efflux transporter metallochaperone ArsD [Roseiconus lacunae]|uniref:arsenite efflux transporter metallochaperone ArsD n=1 Tax=Roseiconus lacunae TaxID=2605694 RepID=UPI001E523258|nr:arsenite efflux transporter metallochaperone ArsD [Roseiconus lacunae]MCD0457991.1 arsenite efflux transporter metallochaperone ArsD [Roseiconus lacunae]